MALINGVRIGAAAFALGLSLAGPQALGVATADTPDADSPSVSAGPAASHSAGPAAGRRAAGRAARSAAAAAPATTASPRAAATVTTAADDGPLVATGPTARAARPAARPQTRRRASEVLTSPPAAAVAGTASPDRPPQTPAPTAAQPVDGLAPAAAATPPLADIPTPPADVSSTRPAATCGSCWAFGAVGGGGTPVSATPPTLHQVATVRLAQTLDRLGNWLTGLPANPFTGYLTGALQLVRRTLLPNVPTIPKVTVDNVSVLEPVSGTTDAVFTITLDKAYATPVTVGYGTSTPTIFDQIIGESSFNGLNGGMLDPMQMTHLQMLMQNYMSIVQMWSSIVKQFGDLDRPIATPGQDYTPVSGLLTFAPGQTSQLVSVPVLSDTADEPPETFGLNVYPTLLSGSAASEGTGVALARGVGTIYNSAPAATIVIPTQYPNVLVRLDEVSADFQSVSVVAEGASFDRPFTPLYFGGSVVVLRASGYTVNLQMSGTNLISVELKDGHGDSPSTVTVQAWGLGPHQRIDLGSGAWIEFQ